MKSCEKKENSHKNGIAHAVTHHKMVDLGNPGDSLAVVRPPERRVFFSLVDAGGARQQRKRQGGNLLEEGKPATAVSHLLLAVEFRRQHHRVLVRDPCAPPEAASDRPLHGRHKGRHVAPACESGEMVVRGRAERKRKINKG